VALSHIPLSHYAATSRGYPPRDAFWQHVAVFLPFLGLALPTVFDDGARHPERRTRLLAAYGCWGSLILGTVAANVHSGTPSIGHLTGMIGVVLHCWFEIFWYALFWSILVLPFVFCFESMMRASWDLVRRFPDAKIPNRSDETAMRDARSVKSE